LSVVMLLDSRKYRLGDVISARYGHENQSRH